MEKYIFDRNLPYNGLPLLPPAKRLEDNPKLLKLLVLASRRLATVDGNVNRLPNPSMLVNTIALQEAKTSTEIENIFTTEDELYKAISDNFQKENINASTKEVLRYREALWAGYHQLSDGKTINEELIKKIFQQIKDTSSGFRAPQSKVVIKRGNSEYRPGEIIYTPPRGEKLVKNLMGNLIDYMNDDTKFPTDPLLKMCVAHYQFEAIHPFIDGNGRTGRILNLLYLIDKKLLSHPILYMSKYIISNKEEYYYRLGAVTQRQDWEAWIEYMLSAIDNTSSLTNTLINDIIEQMDSTYTYAKKKIDWYSKEINETLFSQPYMKAIVFGKVIGKTSRTTITKYLNQLVEHKILSTKKDGTEVYYMNEDLMRILEG